MTDARLVVTISRDEKVVDYAVVRDGYAAQAEAISLLEDIGALQAGDILVVRHFSDPALPEFSRASHMGG